MFFLILIIVASLIIVYLVIRRLPSMRFARMGMEVRSPMIRGQEPIWRRLINSVSIWFGNLSMPSVRSISLPSLPKRPRMNLPIPSILPSMNQSSNMAGSGGANHQLSTMKSYNPNEGLPGDDGEDSNGNQSAAHDNFWQEPELAVSHIDKLITPSKGLINRRGESQKIAQELIGKAEELFNKKQYHQAETFYLQAATKDPDNSRVYNRLGVIYLQTKNYKDAVEAFRGAIRLDDRVACRHFNLGLAYLGKRDIRSAEKALREAVKLEPTNDKYRQTLKRLQESV